MQAYFTGQQRSTHIAYLSRMLTGPESRWEEHAFYPSQQENTPSCWNCAQVTPLLGLLPFWLRVAITQAALWGACRRQKASGFPTPTHAVLRVCSLSRSSPVPHVMDAFEPVSSW